MTYVLYVGNKKIGNNPAKSLKTARAKAYEYIQGHPPMVVTVKDADHKNAVVGRMQIKGGEILFDNGGNGRYAVNKDGSLSVAKGKPSKDVPKVFKTTKIAKRAQEDAYDWRKDTTTFSNIMPPDKSKGRWVIVLTNDRLFGDTGSNIEGIVQRDGETVLPYDAKNPHRSLGGALRYTDKEIGAMHKATSTLNRTLKGNDANIKLYACRIIEEYTVTDKNGKTVRRVRFKVMDGQADDDKDKKSAGKKKTLRDNAKKVGKFVADNALDVAFAGAEMFIEGL